MSDWNILKDEETLQLTELYQDKGNPDSLRENAFHALCHRFKKDVLNKCEITSKRFGHDITVAELVATATFSSYAKKGDFQINKARKKNVDDAFKNYLYKIARNEFTNYYRQQQRKINNPYDGSEEIVTELPNLKGVQLNMEQAIIIKAIESLTTAQRTVYLTYTKYEKLGFNLPKKLREQLRVHLGGIEQSTIRTYKKEALEKIKSYKEVMKLTKELSDGKV